MHVVGFPWVGRHGLNFRKGLFNPPMEKICGFVSYETAIKHLEEIVLYSTVLSWSR
jgi:hypothetical protein